MSKLKTGTAIGIGAGLAAAAVGAALGSYLLTGKRATKTKKVLKSWMLKAKGELLEQMENAGEMSEEMFNKAVDQLANKYSKMAGVTKEEVEDMVKELKKQYKIMSREFDAKVKKLAR